MTEAKGFAVEITRFIKAPRGCVFDAFTIPQQIVKWIGPEDHDAISAEVDLRIGGKYSVRFHVESYGDLEAHGVFREIVRPSRLAYTWQWDDPRLDVGETLITVDFVEANGKTEIRFRHEGLATVEDRDGHNEGWSRSLDKLEELFS